MQLLLLALTITGVCAGPSVTRIFSEQDQLGYYYDTYTYIPDLSVVDFDDDVDSCYQTGMWMYYGSYDYRALLAGQVYWAHGIQISVSFPLEYSNMTSSLRYAGSAIYLNENTLTLYEGVSFTGSQYYATYDLGSLGSLAGTVSSLIMTGLSPWTVYSQEGWKGNYSCIYPDTDHDVGPSGERLDLGLYPDITDFGIPDNSIMSVRLGCFSDRVVEVPKESGLKVLGRSSNGAWGYVDL